MRMKSSLNPPDSFNDVDLEKRRREMVEAQLEGRDIRDPRVLDVMRTLPRERFLPQSLVHQAYEDRALGVQLEQTISQPYIVAFMTQALDLEPHHRVLEIGTGTGYQTAILAMLCKHVYSIERFAELSRGAAESLHQLGFDNATLTVGDGSLGWPEHAPYDRIIITAAAPSVPSSVIEQLVDGGRMVLPIGAEESQRIVTIDRRGETLVERPLIPVRFVKLVGKEGFNQTVEE